MSSPGYNYGHPDTTHTWPVSRWPSATSHFGRRFCINSTIQLYSSLVSFPARYKSIMAFLISISAPRRPNSSRILYSMVRGSSYTHLLLLYQTIGARFIERLFLLYPYFSSPSTWEGDKNSLCHPCLSVLSPFVFLDMTRFSGPRVTKVTKVTIKKRYREIVR